MRRRNSLRVSVVFLVLTCCTAAAVAEVKLPAVIGEGMVLQREMPVPVWGWAKPGEKISVTFDNQSVTTKTGEDGRWKVALKQLKASAEPKPMAVRGDSGEAITLKNILVGEVWVGSGQSNMEMHLRSTQGAAEAIAAAKFPDIRLFHVPKVQKPKPEKDVNAAWKPCTPETVPSFSAVLFYFGRKLHEELKVPIGLINSSWGGSPIEPWTVAGEKSGGMYNGMISPLQPFAVRGAIWYQGETNVMHKNGFAYYGKMKALVEGWRKTWGNDNLSFYFVQIAPWSRYVPGQLPALWEAQVASMKIPGTGMIVTTDLVDNIGDIHPRNKLDVGNRLARWALAKDYGQKDLVYSGPLYKSMKVEGDKIRLCFDHVGGGLVSRDGKPLSEFQIAGADGKFVPAKATIDGQTVVVEADGVASPTQVRFGWHKVANPNLANKEGLPASPFKTDQWKGSGGPTAGKPAR